MRSLMLAAFAAALAMIVAPAGAAGDLSPTANAAYLAANAHKPGVKVTADGLQYRVIKAGTGRTPKPTDNVVVTYKGSLIDGTVFDQTQAGQTATFPAGKLIKGWVEALGMMKEGDTWELTIPSGLAYGDSGTPDGTIPGKQTLVFTMTLLKVQ